MIEVDDLDATIGRLRAAGARFRNEPIEGPGGRQVLAEDPSGNPVELFEATSGMTPAARPAARACRSSKACSAPAGPACRNFPPTTPSGRPRRAGRPHGVPAVSTTRRPRLCWASRFVLLRDRGRAEDVLQDAFVSVWHRAGGFRA